jgi:hypothetical protein
LIELFRVQVRVGPAVEWLRQLRVDGDGSRVVGNRRLELPSLLSRLPRLLYRFASRGPRRMAVPKSSKAFNG